MADTKSKTRGVDWEQFYRALERFRVELPSFNPGEPPDPASIVSLMFKVQNHRNGLDTIARKIEQRLASYRTKVQILTEQLRHERILWEADPAVASLRTKAARKEQADMLSSTTAARLAFCKGEVAQYESAKKVVTMQLDTLETAKQTLNAARAMLAGPMPGGFAPHSQRNGQHGW